MRELEEIRGEIVRLAHVDLDLQEFARGAMRALRRAVSFDGAAVVAFDPATALPVDKWIDNSLTGSAGARLAEIELHEPDVNKFRQLAVSGPRAASLSQATGGKLTRSLRHRELLRPRGLGDELRTVCVSDSGTWGALVLHRESGAPDFAAKDVALLESLSASFAEALQRVSLKLDLADRAGDDLPGLLLLDPDDAVETANAAAAAWLDDLRDHGPLPLVVTAVAQRARAIASGRAEAAATARVRTESGRWTLVRGSVLGDARTAITIEPARAPELSDLIAHAYHLTPRERRITQLVAQGLSTAAVATRLHLSTYTVQDHLKAIFEKLGVSSRGALVAKLFIDHYQVEGRLRRC
jgi:DNA-binding NarL/FixJ family response regulator